MLAVRHGRSAWALLATALALGVCVAACAPRPRARLGARAGGGEPAASNAGRDGATCASCHAEVAEEWRASLHRSAFTDRPFARAYAREPRAFCRDCHAPEGDPSAGVSCLSCHRVDERAPRPAGSPHPPHRAATGPSAACARCHEFAFDDERARGAIALMQSTVREHAASTSRETSCVSCHMPRVAGHRSHRFGITRDAGALRDALAVEAVRVGDARVRLRLRALGVGHAFPTGDLFRGLQVSVETDDDPTDVAFARPTARPPAIATKLLTRRFTTVRGPTGASIVVETSDDRLAPDRASEVELDLGEHGRGRPVRWRVEYHRAEVADDDPAPDARVVLHTGRLSP